MKSYLIFITLILPFLVSCTKGEEMEYRLGTYWNHYCNEYLEVSATVKKDGKLRLFFEIPNNHVHQDIHKTKVEIKEEDISEFRKELLDVRNKIKDLKKTYRKIRKGEILEINIDDNQLPSMRFCWEIEGVWKTSDWYKGSPVFHAEKGNYSKYEGWQGIPHSQSESAFVFENQYGESIKIAHWTFVAHRVILKSVNGKCSICATTLLY